MGTAEGTHGRGHVFSSVPGACYPRHKELFNFLPFGRFTTARHVSGKIAAIVDCSTVGLAGIRVQPGILARSVCAATLKREHLISAPFRHYPGLPPVLFGLRYPDNSPWILAQATS